MSKMIQCFAFIFCIFFIVGCSDATQKKEEPKKTTETPAARANKPQPKVNEIKVFTAQGVNAQGAKAWKIFKGNTVKWQKGGGILLTSALSSPVSSGITQGARLTIPATQAVELSGKKIQVVVDAAKPKENSASEFAVAYSTAEIGNSGWKKFTPTEKFAPYTFEYRVPKCKKCNEDFIGIWADTKGAGKGLIVKSVSVKILN